MFVQAQLYFKYSYALLLILPLIMYLALWPAWLTGDKF